MATAHGDFVVLGPTVVSGATLHCLSDENIAPTAHADGIEHLHEKLAHDAAAWLARGIIGLVRLIGDHHPDRFLLTAAEHWRRSGQRTRAAGALCDRLPQAWPGR
jgi:hypothetical protein